MGDVVELKFFRPDFHTPDTERDIARQADQSLISSIRAFCIAAEKLLQYDPMPKDIRVKAMRMQAIAKDQPIV